MIAAIYARKGTDLWGSVVTAWRWVDWTAVASLATLAAVGVALLPVFLSWRRDRAMRRLLRAQALVHLTALRRPFEGKPAGILSVQMGPEYEALRSLLPSAHFLARREAEALIDAVRGLVLLMTLNQYDEADVQNFRSIIDKAINTLKS